MNWQEFREKLVAVNVLANGISRRSGKQVVFTALTLGLPAEERDLLGVYLKICLGEDLGRRKEELAELVAMGVVDLVEGRVVARKHEDIPPYDARDEDEPI